MLEFCVLPEQDIEFVLPYRDMRNLVLILLIQMSRVNVVHF